MTGSSWAGLADSVPSLPCRTRRDGSDDSDRTEAPSQSLRLIVKILCYGESWSVWLGRLRVAGGPNFSGQALRNQALANWQPDSQPGPEAVTVETREPGTGVRILPQER